MPNRMNLMMAEELAKRYPKGTDYVVVGHTKLSGLETTLLRKLLRDGKARMEVVKNSIATHAMKATGLGAGAKFLQGPSALVTGDVEMPELCRIVTDIAKKFENKLLVRGGLMGETALGADRIVYLATIPPLPVMRAKMAGSIQAPVVRVAGAFQSILRSLACALEGIRNQKEGQVPPQPPAAASEPAPAAAT